MLYVYKKCNKYGFRNRTKYFTKPNYDEITKLNDKFYLCKIKTINEPGKSWYTKYNTTYHLYTNNGGFIQELFTVYDTYVSYKLHDNLLIFSIRNGINILVFLTPKKKINVIRTYNFSISCDTLTTISEIYSYNESTDNDKYCLNLSIKEYNIDNGRLIKEINFKLNNVIKCINEINALNMETNKYFYKLNKHLLILNKI